MTGEGFDLEREVHYILFDVMDLTVGQEKELREKFIAFGRRCYEQGIERAAEVIRASYPEDFDALDGYKEILALKGGGGEA